MALDQIDIDKDRLPEKYRKQVPQQKADMTFFEHLDVLRGHLFRSAISILVCGFLVAFFISFVVDDILFAPLRPDFVTYRVMCEWADYFQQPMLCLEVKPVKLSNLELNGQFMMHINTSVTAGLLLSFPFVVYQIWKFIRPALKEKEAKNALSFVFFVSLLFFIGLLFAYYVVFPLSYHFLITYTISEQIQDQPTVQTYMSTMTDLLIAGGVIFQLPVMVFMLTKIGLLTPEFMVKYRRHSVVVILLLSAILSPDVITMLILSFPLYGLFEFSVWISKLQFKKNLKNAI